MWFNLGLSLLLIVFALLEILTTGFLYSKYGAMKLLSIYLITTILGIFCLTFTARTYTQAKTKLEDISKSTSFREMMSIWKERNINLKNSEERTLVILLSLPFFYILGWIFILIPGLITDLVSYYLIIMCWISNMKLKYPLTSQKNTSAPPTTRDSSHF